VKHTYGSRNRQFLKSAPQPPSSPLSTLSSSPPAIVRPSKRLFSDLASPSVDENFSSTFRPLKRPKTVLKPTTVARKLGTKVIPKTQQTLTQLHFNIDQTILRNCSLCDLSYTKGAPDDEALHRVHCSRVRQGMEWGREEEKDRVRNGKTVVLEVKTDIKLRDSKKKGRIISFSADIGGKLSTKVGRTRSSYAHHANLFKLTACNPSPNDKFIPICS
jgi:N-acetyltransferase